MEMYNPKTFEFSGRCKGKTVNRRFQVLLKVTSFAHISLGFHVDFSSPNIEIHFPFGFVRIGWTGVLIPDSMEDILFCCTENI
jgi:hypothetical protein